MDRGHYSKVLSKFIVPEAVSGIIDLIGNQPIQLKITKGRKSKFGDYRPPSNGSPYHKISVNGSLDPASFLITLLHEIAHFHCFEKFGPSRNPHGKEWKLEFKLVAQPFLTASIFESKILEAFRQYLENPKASTMSDANLYRVLRKSKDSTLTLIEELPKGVLFDYNGRVFSLGEKRRTKYLCIEQKTKRPFLFNGLAEVTVIK